MKGKGLKLLPLSFTYVDINLEVLHQNPRFLKTWVPSFVFTFGSQKKLWQYMHETTTNLISTLINNTLVDHGH